MFGHSDHHQDDNQQQNFGQDNQQAQQPVSDPTASAPQDTSVMQNGSLEEASTTANENQTQSSFTAPSPDPVTEPASPTPSGVSEELLTIKQQALQDLSPLVSHLEQSPEEKFKTTMMMIQASDDQSLLNEAYKAAQNITDDKARAQALLDIVNEINYFTQAHHAQAA
jgi:hypothetical protein